MISLDRADAIVFVSLDRPENRNAFGVKDWQLLADVAAELSQDECVAVILRSLAPKAFCSGSDLGEIAGLAGDVAARTNFRHAMGAAIEGIAKLPMPVVSVIEGACFGAGVALALACDIRIAGTAAKFGVPPAKLGISYPQQDVRRLVRAVGRGQAARLLFTAQAVSAEEALMLGLVDMVTAQPAEAAHDLVRQICANDPLSIRALKSGIASVDKADASDCGAAFDAMFSSEGFRSRIAAVRSKS